MAQICAHVDQHPTGDGRGSTVTGLDYFQCLTCGRRTGYDGKPYPVPHSSVVFPTMYTVAHTSSTNYLTAPDSAALSIVGDLDIRMRVSLDDWTPTTGNMSLVAKWTTASNQRAYFFRVNTTGTLTFTGSSNGTLTDIQATSTASVPAADGTAKWVKVTRVQSSGVHTFSTSDDGNNWTPLGNTVTAGAGTALTDTTAVVELGSRDVGTAEPLAGNIYYAEIRSGIDGTLAGYFNANEVVIGGNNQLPTTLVNGATTWAWNGTGYSWRKAS